MAGSDKAKMQGRMTVSLDGLWHYQADESGQGWEQRLYSPETKIDSWPTMDLPTNWYLTELGDFSGMVWFARDFTLPAEWVGLVVRLVFNAVDYRAHVWVNGVYVGNHEGMFSPFGMYIGENVKWGQSNRLVVCVNSPADPTPYCIPRDERAKAYESDEFRLVWATDLTVIKGHMIDATNRPGGMTRSKQKGNSGGIWQGIELIATKRYNIERIKITPRLVYRRSAPIGDGAQDREIEQYDDSALIGVEVEIFNGDNAVTTAEVELSISPAGTEGALRCQPDPGQPPQDRVVQRKRVDLVPGLNTVHLYQTLSNPKLWWCWDHGDPNLYEAHVKVTGIDDPGAVDQLSDTFGIRDFRSGDDGIWYLNGRRVFVRGMRYISSQWLSQTTPAQYEEDLRQMKSLSINAVRIGSHVEKPVFYRICDKLGIMVWQVFPTHFNYSDDDDLIARAAPMIKEMGNLFYNRPSMVRWSVAKEPWGPSGFARYDELGRRDPNNYGRLSHALQDALRSVDPIRPIHLGDYLGSVNFTPGSCQPITADVNKVYLRPTVSEFANGGSPIVRVELLRKILDERDLWPPNWDAWAQNVFIYQWFVNGYGYNKTLKEIEAMTLESFVEETQALARELVKEEVEFIRQNKYRPVGSMFFYWWNDPCPSIQSSGVLDSDRCPNASWEALQQTYTPVLVSFAWEKPVQRILGLRKTYYLGELFRAKVWVTSDLPQCVPDALLSWELLSPQEERILYSQSSIVLEDRSWIADEVEWKIDGACGLYTLKGTVCNPQGEVLSSNLWKFLVEKE